MKPKTWVGIMLIVLLIGLPSFSFHIQTVRAEPTTWTVDDDGPADFSSIQDAINSPSVVNGDTIFVYSGAYHENVVVDKTLSLIGENMHSTIIDGMGIGFVMDIKVNNVSVTGFTIQGSGYGGWDSGIQIDSSVGINLSHNILTNNQAGILLWYSDDNDITFNTAILNTLDGIVLIESSNNIVADNIASNNMYGIALSSFSDGNTVTSNIASGNDYGISIWYDSDGNSVVGNNISKNDYGIYLFDSNFNLILHNNFLDNALQAYSEGSMNVWDDGYSSCGNFWSDYTDQDFFIGPNQNEPGSDGVWDHPYIIDDTNQDRYPLVNPWTPSWIPPWMPPEAFADLIRRKAWLEHHRFDISRDEDGNQTLFAKVRNLSPLGWDLNVYAGFEIVRSDGFVITLVTETRTVAPGEVVTLTANFGPLDALDRGKYYASAECYYSYTGSTWAIGASIKTLSFSIVP